MVMETLAEPQLANRERQIENALEAYRQKEREGSKMTKFYARAKLAKNGMPVKINKSTERMSLNSTDIYGNIFAYVRNELAKVLVIGNTLTGVKTEIKDLVNHIEQHFEYDVNTAKLQATTNISETVLSMSKVTEGESVKTVKCDAETQTCADIIERKQYCETLSENLIEKRNAVDNHQFSSGNLDTTGNINEDSKDKDKFECHICYRVFNKVFNFDRHLQLKHGEKPFLRCEPCDTKFPDRRTFKRHLNYECPYQEIRFCMVMETLAGPQLAYKERQKEVALEAYLQKEREDRNMTNFYALDRLAKNGKPEKNNRTMECISMDPTDLYGNIFAYVRNELVKILVISTTLTDVKSEIKDLVNYIEQHFIIEYDVNTAKFQATTTISETVLRMSKVIEGESVNTKENAYLSFGVNPVKYDAETQTGTYITERKQYCETLSANRNVKRNTVDNHQLSSGNLDTNGNGNEDSKHKEKFKCHICYRVFNRSFNFDRHLRMKHGEKPFLRCEPCDTKFHDRLAFNRHMNHECPYKEILRFPCKFCSKVFKRKWDLLDHTSKHTCETGFLCDICGKLCKTRNNLKDHRFKHKIKIRLICHICQKSFCDRTLLKYHMQKHTGFHSYTCNFCNRGFPMKCKLEYHIKTVHEKETPYSCEICRKSFPYETSLKYHRMTHFEQRISCGICEKQMFKRYLETHMKRIHFSKKDHVCSTCGKSFISRMYLKSHQWTHTADRPHKCSFCSKSFSTRHRHTVHENVHKQIKPYTCEHCGKKYSVRSTFTKHKCQKENE